MKVLGTYLDKYNRKNIYLHTCKHGYYISTSNEIIDWFVSEESAIEYCIKNLSDFKNST